MGQVRRSHEVARKIGNPRLAIAEYGDAPTFKKGNKSGKLFPLSPYNMFLVILTASEDITDQNSYLCPTRLILLLCISLWRHSNLTEIRLVVIF